MQSNFNEDTLKNRFNEQTLQSNNFNEDTMKNRFNELTTQSNYLNEDTMKNRFNDQTLQSNNLHQDTMKNRFNEQTLQSNYVNQDTMKSRFNDLTIQSNNLNEDTMKNRFNDQTIQSINIDSSDISVQQGLTSPYILQQDEIVGHDNTIANQGFNNNLKFDETYESVNVPTRHLEPRVLKNLQFGRGHTPRNFPGRNYLPSNSADNRYSRHNNSGHGFRPNNSSRIGHIQNNNEFLDETIQSIECNTNELPIKRCKPHSYSGPYRNYSLDNSRMDKYKDPNQIRDASNRNLEIRDSARNEFFKKKNISNKDTYLNLFKIKKSTHNSYVKQDDHNQINSNSNRRGFMDIYDKSQNSDFTKERNVMNEMANEREMSRVMDVYDAYLRKDQKFDVNTRFPTIRDKSSDV